MKRRVRLGIAGLAAAGALIAAAAPFVAGDGASHRQQPAVAAVSPPPTPAAVSKPEVGRVFTAGTRSSSPKPDRSRELELPDGTFVPALNGAVDATPLATYWGPSAWSPITGVERSSAGVDWYQHADGSYSTTQMVWRKDLGRSAAMTRVAHPGPAVPVAAAPRTR